PHCLFETVSLNAITEVYDHHFGFEEFWKNQIGSKAKIERVGACATLIWEQYKMKGLGDHIYPTDANLLCTAIFSNTLDFKSKMTSKRDLSAFDELQTLSTLSSTWKSEYYSSIQKNILKNVTQSILDDTKIVKFMRKNLYFGQIELWNSSGLIFSINQHSLQNCFEDKFRETNPFFILNSVSIQENKSYIITNVPILKEYLECYTKAHPLDAEVLVTDSLWQRKELLAGMTMLLNK
ncbi:MAG: hypothetical protein K2X39_04085, partial [Silvanigrellaceae bacterium]|nr:hypothetical protein [Silvanigrellaceae bacterium]